MSAANPDPLIGTQLGDYAIRSPLGSGGYADVYVAVQARLDREVALKVLREGPDGVQADQVEAFFREARAAAAFSHPNLVHVHDVGEADGRHFLSMELVRGGTLAAALKSSGGLPWRRAVRLCIDVSEALHCAHQHDMLHQDVKPANILLTADDRAKLADLGLAGVEENVGTKAFMAPERILRKDTDVRSDLYSLGCTLYAMLTGEVPFDKPTSKEMLIAHVKERAHPIHASGTIIPDELEKIVASLLAKNPNRRPRTANELLTQLRDIDLSDDPPLRRGHAGASKPRPEVAVTMPPPAQRQTIPTAARPASQAKREPEVESQGPTTVPRSRRARRRRQGDDIPWGMIVGLGLVAGVVVAGLWAWRKFG